MRDKIWDRVLASMGDGGSALDNHLREHERRAKHEGLQSLLDATKDQVMLQIPVSPGTRVAFDSNVGTALVYDHPVPSGSAGTVVLVRTASGDLTGIGDMVFVKFDGGEFMPTHRHHLRAIKSAPSKNLVRKAMDLSQFLQIAKTEPDLIKKSTKDLWSLAKNDKGEVVIARLFDETGQPLQC